MNNYKISKNTEWKEVEINGDIQEVPVDWGVSTIDEISDIVFGQSPENYEDLTRKELSNETIEFHQGNSFFSKKYLEQSNVFLNNCSYLKKALANSIVMSVRAPVGAVNITKKDIVIGRGLAAIKNKNNPLTYYMLKSIPVQNYMKKISSGSIFESIKSSEFKKIQVINPVLQQSSIASILSTQESIVNDMETLVEKYETRLRYLSEELLSGRLRIKEVEGKIVFYKNKEWKEVEINGEIKEIPVDWSIVSIEKAIEMEKNTKNSQILNSLILNNGKIPVVGQEVEFISGYTNNSNSLHASKDNPIIIFGDHSCTLKFITFNYMLGGDGTKVFKGNGLVKTKFLYYSIKNLNFNTDGYKRHFSILKEKLINIPYIDQQVLISKTLCEQEIIINDMKELLEKEKKKFNFLLNNLLSGNYLVEKVA